MSLGGWIFSASLISVALSAEPAGTQEMRRAPAGLLGGVVTDQETEDPLSEVEVLLITSDESGALRRTAVSDDEGRFQFQQVAGGTYEVLFRRLGYGERLDSLNFVSGTFVDLQVSLAQEAIKLEEITVTVGSVLLARQGFYDRMRQGFRGTFIERTDIEEERPASVTELFQNIRGVTVVWGGVYGAQIFMNQRSSFTSNHPGCRPEIWLDGIRSTIESLDVMRVEELEGIEVYRGGAPGSWTDPCGTIAVWTRRVIR